MKVLILTNGELYQRDVLRNRINTEVFDLVIGVDGGARYAHTLNIALDLVIGDIDSLSNFERQDFMNTDFISYPPEKDETDLELALLYAKGQGVNNIVIIGALGRRMDMTIANILLLANTRFSLSKIEVWHGEQTIWLIKPPGEEISGSPGDMVSLIPLGNDISGITTKGLKYPLKGEEISFGHTRGISNLFEGSSAHIQLSNGLLLAIHIPRQV